MAVKDNSVYSCLTIFTRVLQLVRQDYVDEDKVDYRALTYNALRGMLGGLDPHSQFMEPDSFKDMQDDTRSRYDGLGLVVSAKDGVLIIVSALEDSPASKAGLSSGDQILKINGATTEKMQLTDAITALKGKPGESITMQILRPASKEVRDFTMVRTEIKVESVKDAHLIDPSNVRCRTKLGTCGSSNSTSRPRRISSIAAGRPAKAGHGSAGDRPAQQPRRPAQQRRGRVRAVPAAEHDGRLHGGPNALDSQASTRTSTVGPATRGDFPGGRAHQRRQRQRRGNRGRRAEGFESRRSWWGRRRSARAVCKASSALPDGSAVRLTTAKYFTPSKQVIHQHGVVPDHPRDA